MLWSQPSALKSVERESVAAPPRPHATRRLNDDRDDDWNPDPARHKDGMPFPSVLGDIPIPDESSRRFAELRQAHVEGMG